MQKTEFSDIKTVSSLLLVGLRFWQAMMLGMNVLHGFCQKAEKSRERLFKKMIDNVHGGQSTAIRRERAVLRSAKIKEGHQVRAPNAGNVVEKITKIEKAKNGGNYNEENY